MKARDAGDMLALIPLERFPHELNRQGFPSLR
jgi:hypothetical protein